MAKCKRSNRRPQPQHRKAKKSQHDKRKRLDLRNCNRRKTTKAKVPLAGAMQKVVSVLQAVMDRRIAFRLAILIAGMFLADGRRTASSWFVAAGVQDDWDRFYACLKSVGRTSEKVATAVLGLVVQKFAPKLGDRILLAMDDSPTARYGRHVEGAGVHHNPTGGPADSEWLYGQPPGPTARRIPPRSPGIPSPSTRVGRRSSQVGPGDGRRTTTRPGPIRTRAKAAGRPPIYATDVPLVGVEAGKLLKQQVPCQCGSFPWMQV